MNYEQEQAWRDSLAAGDEIAVTRGWSSGHTIEKVGRVTSTQIVVGNKKFRKSDGYMVGSSGFHRQRLCPVTQDIRDKEETRYLIGRLESITKTERSLPVLRAIDKAYREAKNAD